MTSVLDGLGDPVGDVPAAFPLAIQRAAGRLSAGPAAASALTGTYRLAEKGAWPIATTV